MQQFFSYSMISDLFETILLILSLFVTYFPETNDLKFEYFSSICIHSPNIFFSAFISAISPNFTAIIFTSLHTNISSKMWKLINLLINMNWWRCSLTIVKKLFPTYFFLLVQCCFEVVELLVKILSRRPLHFVPSFVEICQTPILNFLRVFCLAPAAHDLLRDHDYCAVVPLVQIVTHLYTGLDVETVDKTIDSSWIQTQAAQILAIIKIYTQF